MHKHRALITGATAGIGKATAELLAKNGFDLVITGRRQEKLNQLKSDIQRDNDVDILALRFDVSNRAELEATLNANIDIIKKTDILINNAGLAQGIDPIDEGDIDGWEKVIDTNIKGLLYMSRFMLPIMKENGLGHVINIGSIAGHWTYPGGNVYSATKFAVRSLTEGMRIDLLGTPIRVSNIAPGMVETEFSLVRFGNDAKKAKSIYENMTALNAGDVAESILWVISRPAHVNIQEVVIYPTHQASPNHIHRENANDSKS